METVDAPSADGQRPRMSVMSSSGSPQTALLFGVSVLLCVASAAAHTRGSDGLPLPRVFVGAGAGPATNDATSRMRLYEQGLAAVWLVEAGAAVSERVGLGVEYARPSAATAFTTIGAGRAQIAGRQEERTLLAMARARVAGMKRWALDVVGGAGVLFQHHESGGASPLRTAAKTPTTGPSMSGRPRLPSVWTCQSGSPGPSRLRPTCARTSCAAANTRANPTSIYPGSTNGSRSRGRPPQ
jgi:hypothetical protein